MRGRLPCSRPLQCLRGDAGAGRGDGGKERGGRGPDRCRGAEGAGRLSGGRAPRRPLGGDRHGRAPAASEPFPPDRARAGEPRRSRPGLAEPCGSRTNPGIDVVRPGPGRDHRPPRRSARLCASCSRPWWPAGTWARRCRSAGVALSRWDPPRPARPRRHFGRAAFWISPPSRRCAWLRTRRRAPSSAAGCRPARPTDALCPRRPWISPCSAWTRGTKAPKAVRRTAGKLLLGQAEVELEGERVGVRPEARDHSQWPADPTRAYGDGFSPAGLEGTRGNRRQPDWGGTNSGCLGVSGRTGYRCTTLASPRSSAPWICAEEMPSPEPWPCALPPRVSRQTREITP